MNCHKADHVFRPLMEVHKAGLSGRTLYM